MSASPTADPRPVPAQTPAPRPGPVATARGAAHGTKLRRWICCADDYAIDGGAIDGIVDLIEHGRITATSALVDSPLWRTAVGSLPADTRADIGLHLNLTQAFPGQESAVWPLAELIVRCRLRMISRSRVRAAIERQLDAFEDALGRPPDYIDGHQHVHQFAVVRDELIAALLQRYARALPWLRRTRPPPLIRDRKARFIAALGDSALRKRAASAGVATSDYLVGVYGFDADAATYLRRLRQWIQAGPEGTVLMCHPAQHSHAGDPIAAARTTEYKVLGAADFPAALVASGIALTRGTGLFVAAKG